MLTVKLVKGKTIKIIEATEVNVFPCGKAEGSEQNPAARTNKFREISVSTYTGGQKSFYIGDPEDSAICFHGPFEVFDCAYIENAHGATTESVYAGCSTKPSSTFKYPPSAAEYVPEIPLA